jgi:hypothetical protein
VVWMALFIRFAIKIPAFPFHLVAGRPRRSLSRRSRSSWLAYCSRWAPTGSCGSIFPCCRRQRLILLSGSWAR